MTHRRRRWRRLALAVALAGVAAWGALVVAIVLWGRRDVARRSDAIIVLGAAQYVGRPSPVFRARLDHGIGLWRRGLAPLLVVTGGRGEGDTTTEAEVGRRYAVRRGIPESAIIMEGRGRTTSESMRAVATMLGVRSSNRVILVSDPFHMLRLAVLARRFGMDAVPSPTTTSPISDNREQRWKYVLGESVKVPLALFVERPQP
ncbi:MAG TPA: YdcF family protein [Gemmatimonadaceae bacterium]|nr:YdcF family protein [Gemmatimonadaceae bacterium]